MTVMQTAGKLAPTYGLSRHCIDTWARQGLFISHKIGNKRLINVADFERFLNSAPDSAQSEQKNSIRPLGRF